MEQLRDSYIHEMVNVDEMYFGIVPGRGTTGAIFIVRQMQEKYIADNKLLSWESLRSYAKEGPMVVLKEPRGQGKGRACYPGLPESESITDTQSEECISKLKA